MKLPRKLTMNAIVDYIAFTGFVFLTTTGVLMRYLLPPGSGHHTTIWSLDRHEWGTIHFWMAVALFGMMSLHIILHWKWIVSVIKGKPRQGSRARFLLGVASLIVVIALGLSPVLSRVQVDDRPGRERSEQIETEDLEDTDVAGDHALRAIEQVYGTTGNQSGGRRNEEFDFEDVPVYGAMTLAEVAKETGVPVSYILNELDIKEKVSAGEQIGRLGRELGFSVSEVRMIVAQYQKAER